MKVIDDKPEGFMKTDEFFLKKEFKVIFTRLERSSTLDHLEKLGVKVKDDKGEALEPMQILGSYADVQGGLSEATKNSTAELVAGAFHMEAFGRIIHEITLAKTH